MIAEASQRRPIVRAVLGSSDDLNTNPDELLGHERGALSTAATERIGLVENANGGSLWLDEILNLPMHARQLLLDFTKFETHRPLGYDRGPSRSTRARGSWKRPQRVAQGPAKGLLCVLRAQIP
jgi:transcriptional regulator with AAA-type ATPase domain